MRFSRESLKTYDEAYPLIIEHYKEISNFHDIKLDPDFEIYKAVEDAGTLRVFTARDDSGTLIGYAVFIVKSNIHYKSSLQATQDVIFIKKKNRGTGMKFISWCDEQLKSEGVQVVYHHVKVKQNFGPALERLGYELIDLIYGRRLDR